MNINDKEMEILGIIMATIILLTIIILLVIVINCKIKVY